MYVNQLPEETRTLVDLLYKIEDLDLQERLFDSVASHNKKRIVATALCCG